MSEMIAYDEVVNFIAAGHSSERIAAFQPSEATRQRVASLVAREKTIGLTAEKSSELDHYIQLEHLMRLAKARARRHLVP
jgi:O-succinylbenzoate synthase